MHSWNIASYLRQSWKKSFGFGLFLYNLCNIVNQIGINLKPKVLPSVTRMLQLYFLEYPLMDWLPLMDPRKYVLFFIYTRQRSLPSSLQDLSNEMPVMWYRSLEALIYTLIIMISIFYAFTHLLLCIYVKYKIEYAKGNILIFHRLTWHLIQELHRSMLCISYKE